MKGIKWAVHYVRIHYLCRMHSWKQSTPALFPSLQSSSLDFFLVHGYFSERITGICRSIGGNVCASV